MDCSPPGSSVRGQGLNLVPLHWEHRVLATGPPGKSLILSVCVLSHIHFFATPWTVAHQAPLSVGFSRQEYWSGLPFPSPGDIPNLGTEPVSPAWQADSLPLSHPGNL